MGDKPRALVIPAAGRGTRMKVVDPDLPKEMLPIGPKPAIQYAVEDGVDAGIEQIIIIISRAKETIREHFSRLAFPVTFRYQNEPRGEADAIALAEHAVESYPIAIMYPDNVYIPAPGALRRLTRTFEQHGTDVLALTLVTEENEMSAADTGKVDLTAMAADLYRILGFFPKGRGHFRRRFTQELRACGIGIFGPHIFDAIRRARNTVTQDEFTDQPVRDLLLKERGLLGVRLPGEVFDTGDPEGYKRCLEQVNA